MFDKILHPTDFSSTAFKAFGYAVTLSKRHRAELELLHVIRTHDFAAIQLEAGSAELDEAYDAIERSLRERAPELLADETEDQPWASMVFRRGYSVAEEIILEADAKEPDLIVMGTHGGSQLRQFFLGSVAETVVRYAPCPVLVCGKGGRAPERLRRILVPVDFSDASRDSTAYAIALASVDNSELCFLHVIEEKPQPDYVPAELEPSDDPEIVEGAEYQLARFASDLDTDGLKTTRRVLVGRPSREITELAEDSGFDVIVMGTSGLRGISRYLLGSTPARVMRRCKVPVLAVHGEGDE
jgi:nucleotide-binding universal stress UspA family protein